MVGLSALLSTYSGDEPDALRDAIESLLDQRHPADEIVLVKDGPLTECSERTIDSLVETAPTITTIGLSHNVGLGRALNAGLEHCSFPLVARMDADDVAVPERFGLQRSYLDAHPDVDVVGGAMAEIDAETGTRHVRSVPTAPGEIERMARRRSPLNHPTVMFRKHAIEAVGGYADLRSMQDYDLWVRLLANGYRLGNLPDVLVKTEVDTGLYARRGGIEYAKYELQLQKRFLEVGHVSKTGAIANLALRLPARLLPNRLRGMLYRRFFRNRETTEAER